MDGRQRLFGEIGVARGFFSADALARAQEGLTDEAVGDLADRLADRLAAAGDLDPARRAELERLVAEALEGAREIPAAPRGGTETWGGEAPAPEARDRTQSWPGPGGEAAGLPGTPASPGGQVTRESPGRYMLLDWPTFRGARERRPTADPERATIGAGGMGRILLALDGHVGREVAVKEINPSLARSLLPGAATGQGSFAARFLREARVTGILEHPGIIPVYEVGQRPDGSFYYTMRLIRGRALSRAIAEAGSLRERLALLPHVAGLCHAIAYAHSRGVIHRDIKPDNVMVGEFGETVVLDWGLAKLREEGEHSAPLPHDVGLGGEPGHTRGTALGTPAYMSPEQAAGRSEDVDERSDIWALGVVLYELLTGTIPADGMRPMAMVAWLRDDDAVVEPVTRRCPDAPAELASIAMRCLSRDRQARYPSAREVARDIERYQAGERVVAHRYTTREILHHVVTRNPPLSVAVAVACVVVLCAVGLLWSVRQAHRETAQYRRKNAFEQVLLARGAMAGERPLEAQARLRAALEVDDSVLARALWQEVTATPLLWRGEFDTEVQGLSFSPDGQRLAVARALDTLDLVDTWTGTRERLAGHGPNLYAAAWAPGGQRLAAGAGNGDVVVWDLPGRSRRVVQVHTDVVSCLTFSQAGDSLLSGSFDGTARLVGVDDGAVLRTFAGHEGWVTSVAWGPGEALLATAATDGTARVWEARTGEARTVLSGHTAEVTGLAFSADGATLVSSSTDGTLRLWDLAGGRERGRVPGPSSDFTTFAAGGAGPVLSAGDMGGQVYVWPSPGAGARVLRGHRSLVFSVALTADGTRLASGGMDGVVNLWNLATAPPRPPAGHEGVVAAVAFAPDGHRLASGGWDGTARVWDADGGAQIAVLRGHEDAVFAVRWTPDGGALATGGADGTVRLWDADSWRLLRVFSGHEDGVVSLAFSPDGGLLASGSYDGTARLWDLATGTVREPLRRDGGGRTHVAFAPGDRRLAVSWDLLDGASVAVQELDTGRLRLDAHVEGDAVEGLAFDAPGARLFAVTRAGETLSWDLATGAQATLLHAEGLGRSIAVDPSGRRLAVTSTSAAVLLHEFERVLTTALLGHAGSVSAAAFDATGLRLATAGYDGTVRTWDAGTAQPWWRGILLDPARGFGLTHAGWQPLGAAAAGAAPTARWSAAVAERARFARATPDGRGICLVTRDGGVERWDTADDRQVFAADAAGVEDLAAVPDGCAVLYADGQAALLPRDGAPRPLSPGGGAIAADGTGVLVASPGEIVAFDALGAPADRRTDAAITAPTAVARVGAGIAVGEAHGGVRILGAAGGGTEGDLVLQETPTSAAEALAGGPALLVAAGFGDGTLGLWDGATGRLLRELQLHGPVRHLAFRDGWLHALTELGDGTSLDLTVVTRDPCGLLAEVWDRVPVTWEGSQAVLTPPPADHPCSARRR